jgi:hypothetical protein
MTYHSRLESDRGRAAAQPLSRSVDMTSTVKYPDDARTGRAVGSLGPAPDVVDAGVIGNGTRGL